MGNRVCEECGVTFWRGQKSGGGKGRHFCSAHCRFFSRVTKWPGGCWVWDDRRTSKGYGQIKVNRKDVGAHVFSYTVHVGDVGKMCVLHKCDNPPCVNPDHLFLGTRADNVADMDAKGRRNPAKGESHPHSKLTAVDVVAIRAALANGDSGVSLARRFGVSKSNISLICTGEAWKHLL